MSVLEELRTMEARIAERLRELQPLVDEYEELKDVAERLGLDVTPRPSQTKPVAAKAPAPKRRSRKPTARRAKPKPKAPAVTARDSRRRPGGTRATGVERRERVIALIGERPGITVPDLSKELGVDPPPLYRVVRKLIADGAIKKDGKALTLA